MTAVTIIGPNLYDQSKGQFHVHAKGCSDIARDPKHYGYASAAPHMEAEAKSEEDVAGFVYCDVMDEAEPGSRWTKAEAYVDEFHFAPCVQFNEKESA